MGLVSRLVERRSHTHDPAAIPSNGTLTSTWSGMAVTERTALQHLTVWACVRLLADAVAQLPIGAFRRVDDVRRPVTPSPALIESPYEEWSRYDWLFAYVSSLLLRGNFYGLVASRDRFGVPTQIAPVHPDFVDVRRNPGTRRVEYRIDGQWHTGGPLSDVFHVRGFVLPGALVGLSPIEYAAQGIGVGLAAQKFGAQFFGDGATPSGILEVEKALDPETAKALQATWMQQHNGRRLPAVAGGGMKWKQITISPEESQFLETLGANGVVICGFYGVPPHMVALVDKSTSWGTGIEEQSLGFVTYGAAPWIIRLEQALSALLPRPQFVRLNVSALLRGRLLDRYDAYLKGRQGGWLSVNDIRRLEDEPPVEDGDSYIQPLNFGPLGTDPTKQQDKPQRSDTLVVPPPNVSVHMPEQHIRVAPSPAPDVRVEVPAPDVRVDVAPAEVTVTVEKGGEQVSVERDPQTGQVVRMVRE